MTPLFRDRRDAGRQLAARLGTYLDEPGVLVLGLPRGGVPVAYEVARALGAPLDVFLVRKLGVPGHEELAMGAIASEGIRVLNRKLITQLGISEGVLDAVTASEQRELRRRERLYRGTRPARPLRDRVVILVDDGLATGSTMRAAVEAIRSQGPRRLIAAVPVGAVSVCRALEDVVDETICVVMPEPFLAVGRWYEDFAPTSDEEVQALLHRDTGPAPETGAERLRRGAASASRATHADGLAAIQAAARPFTGTGKDDDPILDLVGDARFVLIGEASHGTHEFYRRRAELTQRLVAEHGFATVAVEADWPDAYRVNRYVRAASDDRSVAEALSDFRRFPQWMWRNTDVVAFLEWLRTHNDTRPSDAMKAGFYGLDLYSLHASIEAVIAYLDQVDPEAARRARVRYACFDSFGDDAQAYGYATAVGAAEPCEDEVVAQLLELQRRAAELAMRDGLLAADEFFYAEQNARLARNAEAYYRSTFGGRVASWNLRDQHMAETLDALMAHLDRTRGRPTKVVVWAHNSHLGDARATQMGAAGELNLGQLVRERHAGDAVLIGFATHEGTVTAARDWGGAAERRRVRPSLAGSYEALFHEVGLPGFLLVLRDGGAAAERLREPRLERAIGVIYRPETERWSHYFEARLPEQFDAVLHYDRTRAVEPLERWAGEESRELPETYPFAGKPLPRPSA